MRNLTFRRLAHWILQERVFPSNGQLRTATGGARETTCLRYCEGKAPGVTLVRSSVFTDGALFPVDSPAPSFRIDGEWTGEQNDVEVFVQYGIVDGVIIWSPNPLSVLYPYTANPYTQDDVTANLLKFSFTLNGVTFKGTMSALVPPIYNFTQDGVILTRTYRSGINSTVHVT